VGTSRCWQEDVVQGFNQRKKRTTVAARKKARRLEVRKIVKKLKAAGKTVDLQSINTEVLNKFRRKRQNVKQKHAVLAVR
jgi:hypothetical protein